MTFIRDINAADGTVVHLEPVMFSLDFKCGEDVAENSAMHDDPYAVVRAPCSLNKRLTISRAIG